MRFINYLIAVLIWFAPASVGLAAEPSLVVRDAYVRGLPPNQKNTAAFFRVVNRGASSVTLMAGASDVAEKLEIHQHMHRDGMMRMAEQASVEVPAGGEFVFMPGNYHLMLIGLKRPLQDGDRVEFSLRTAAGDELIVKAPVISVLKQSHH